MARPIWRGHVSFGLLHIPVGLYPAERRSELHFHLLDSRDHARIRYERVNEATGEEVPWHDIAKAFEYEDGSYVVLGPEDFRRAAVEATRAVDIEACVDREAIEPVYFERPYYLVPDEKATKGYVLLREALRRTGKVGIAKVVIRARQHLAAILPEGDALVLDLLRFEHELVPQSEHQLPAATAAQVGIDPRELAMAEELVDVLSESWQPARYHDEYRDALMQWIEQKVRSGQVETPAEAAPEPELPENADLVDMVELLQRSVALNAARKHPRRGTKRRPGHGAGRSELS